MSTIVGIDLETTGLDPARHDAWECAAIVRGHRDPSCDGEWLWQMLPDLTTADPNGLRIGRYFERRQAFHGDITAHRGLAPLDEDGERRKATFTRRAVAGELAPLLGGATLVGACPWFDAGFLDVFLRTNGQAPAWHHRYVDVEALTAGKLGRVIGGLTKCADELGIAYDPGEAHTALADARLAMRIFDTVIGGAA